MGPATMGSDARQPDEALAPKYINHHDYEVALRHKYTKRAISCVEAD